MGMSSSQARLLTLTARMHDIEHRAQKIEADKLRLANDSRKAYEEYLIALDSKKIQYKSIASDGSITFRDATMNIMQNGCIPNYEGEHALKNLFLQNQEGKIMVTPSVAREFGLDSWAATKSMDDYIKDVTGKDKSTREIYKTVMVDDPDKITGFTPIANTLVTSPSSTSSHTFSPVENEEGGVDYEALKGYAEFNNSHTGATGTEITGTTALTDLTSGGSYQIKTAEGLKQLATLSGSSLPTGITITIANDIDMSGISGWSGIQNFNGTFNGNGYKISNLSGSNGLFASTTAGSTIKNVAMENVNINGNSSFVGGLVGLSNTTNITNCYVTGSVKNNYSGSISDFTSSSGVTSTGTAGLVGCARNSSNATTIFDNIYSSANVTANNADGVGGLLGSAYVLYPNGKFDIKNAYAIGTITGKNGVGGFIGAMYNDEDNPSDVTDIINCYSGGSVNGSSKVGGFFGSYLYWGDNSDISLIKGCNTTSTVSASSEKGAFAGHLWVKMNSATSSTVGVNYLVNFDSCGYVANGLNAYGIITSQDGGSTAEVDGTTYTIEDLVKNTGSASGLVEYNLAGSVPSIEADGSGAYMSNILGVLTKAGLFDACDDTNETPASVSAMKSKIANFLGRFSNDNTGNTKLWYLNIAMCDYLNTGSESDKTLAQALLNDINGSGTSNTASYQNGTPLSGSVKRGAGAEWTPDGTHSLTPGVVEIPSINTIADEIYYSMKTKNMTVNQADVRSWFNSQYGSLTQENKVTLASINEKINKGEDLSDLFSAITSGGSYSSQDYYYDATNPWTINLRGDQTVGYTIGQKPEQQLDHTEEYWDTTDPDIAQAMVWWLVAQRGVIVVTEEQASNYKYLNNIMEVGEAVLTTFKPEAVSSLSGMSESEIMSMTDEQYNELMGIINTNVAVELTVHEVADEKGLKKAEADYEAKLRLIDRKDRNYDTKLAAVESERNAIKQEMETLKTVINDNGERTFKLFS